MEKTMRERDPEDFWRIVWAVFMGFWFFVFSVVFVGLFVYWLIFGDE